ncbi:MAG: hypothetical protein J0H94_04425 [Rhizobiales bacterium]|nr:hypothetical protein [Hyphomicrobiales bacterium]
MPANSPGFGIASSQGNYLNIPKSAWSGDTGTISNVFRTPQGMPTLPGVTGVPSAFLSQAAGAASALNGPDVTGGRNIALMGRAPVNMANANPAATTTPEQMRDQKTAQGFGNFLRSIGEAFGGASPSAASVPQQFRYDPLSSARMPMAPAASQPPPATISPQDFQRRFAPMGMSSIPQDVTYRVASMAPVAAPSSAPVAGVSFVKGPVAQAPDLLGAGGAAGVMGGPPPVPSKFVARTPAPMTAIRALNPPKQVNVGKIGGGLLGNILAGPLGGLIGGFIGNKLIGTRPIQFGTNYGTNQSGLAPTGPGWTQPNFNALSGGSITPYISNGNGSGVFMSSTGRPISYNVNADQAVYGR